MSAYPDPAEIGILVMDARIERIPGLVTADPGIAAILFECANLPPYAATVRVAVGLPVYDAVTMIRHVHAAFSLK